MSDEIVSETAVCKACGAAAATYEFVPKGARHPRASEEKDGLSVYSGAAEGTGGSYIVTRGPCGSSSRGVKAEQAPAVREALARRDWPALRKLDFEYAPGYCCACGAHYCAKDWAKDVVMDEGFYDCTEGTCPAGHRQTIDD